MVSTLLEILGKPYAMGLLYVSPRDLFQPFLRF